MRLFWQLCTWELGCSGEQSRCCCSGCSDEACSTRGWRSGAGGDGHHAESAAATRHNDQSEQAAVVKSVGLEADGRLVDVEGGCGRRVEAGPAGEEFYTLAAAEAGVWAGVGCEVGEGDVRTQSQGFSICMRTRLSILACKHGLSFFAFCPPLRESGTLGNLNTGSCKGFIAQYRI